MQKNTYELLTTKMGIAPRVMEIVDEAEKQVADLFAELDDIKAFNQYKILEAFQE